jgi:hypothetical protein
MNTLVQIVAQAASNNQNGQAEGNLFSGFSIDKIWNGIAGLNWLQAAMIIAFGTIYLIYGWRIFKALVVINFAIIGMFVGIRIGERLGSPLWGGIMTTAILGTLSWPFMKYSVSVLGALAGVVLGAAVWRALPLPENLIWCGALAGLIAGGFMAFSSFKISIILITSFQGAAFVVIGALALLYDYPSLGQHISDAVYSHVFLLPALLLGPTIGGIYFQQKLLKEENKWAMPE